MQSPFRRGPVDDEFEANEVVHIELLSNGSIRCAFPNNLLTALGMLDLGKDMLLTRAKDANRLVRVANGVLSPTKQ